MAVTGWARLYALVRSTKEASVLRAALARVSSKLPEAHELVIDDESEAEFLGARGGTAGVFAEGLDANDVGLAGEIDAHEMPADVDHDVLDEEIDHFLGRAEAAGITFGIRLLGGR